MGIRTPQLAARRWAPHGAAFLLLSALVATVLAWMGRSGWCSGDAPWLPWSGDVWSEHSSQHLFDPYAFTHILHGILFYGLLWLALGRLVSRVGRGWMATGVEAAWEIVENTDAVIERYRQTMAVGYEGDAVVNSVGDIGAFVVGYAMASAVPLRVSLAAFVLVEAALVLTIRDSLLLNVLMLVHPLDAVKQWQMAGG